MTRTSKRKDSDSANGVIEADSPQEFDPIQDAPPEVERPDADSPADEPESEAVEPETFEPPAEVPMPGPIERPKPAEPEPDPFMAKLVERQAEADDLHATYLGLAEDAKQKKKQWESKVEEVASLIRRSSKPMPLFEKRAEAQHEADDAAEREGEEREVMDSEPVLLRIAGLSDAANEAAATEFWESIPVWALVDFGMPKKYVAVLADSGVNTIRDIKALGDRGLDLTEVKGVNAAARDKINAALDAMWKARSEYAAKKERNRRDAAKASADWVDPDAAEDPEADWRPDDRVGLTDAEAAGLDPESLERDGERMDAEYDPDWAGGDDEGDDDDAPANG